MDFQSISNRSLAGDAHFFEDATSPAKVRSFLDSTKEADKLKGMKWLLAMLSKGKDVSEFFPDVVKNVVVKSVEVKKMVYNYLVHYADYNNACREIALLSINSFQKDMSGSNQLIRGLALRVLTSIRVPDIIQIQLLAVRKCATDSSPYVRKCAATAVTKIYSVDSEQLPQLKQILDKLLKDSSTMVLGSAIAAFNEICPTSYDLLHRSYRKICHLLADMDEWSQISCLEVLTRYVRNQFTDPAPGATEAARLQSKHRSTSALKGRLGSTIKRRIVRKAFYSDEEDEEDEEEVEVEVEKIALPEYGSVFNSGDNEVEGDLDPDHRLVLRSAFPLLKSRNSGVVLGVCSLHYYCGSQGDRTNQQVGKALVRILRNHREIQYVVLMSIQTMARDRPIMFRPFLSEFFVKSMDPVFNRSLKLEILTSMAFNDNVQTILKELQVYIKHSNPHFVAATIRAIGRVVDCDPNIVDICMEGLLHLLLCSKNDIIIGETVSVLRQLIQQNTSNPKTSKLLFQLVKLLINEEGSFIIEVPIARASVIWLIGEFHEAIGKVSPDILRILAGGYISESTETKMQILNYAVKLALRYPDDETIQNLMTYVLEMSRYDVDTDLRDRSRLMTALMGLAPTSESNENAINNEQYLEELASHSKNIMLASKLPPVTLLGSVDIEGLPNFTVGSLSSLVGHYVLTYEPIANWPSSQPDPNVRDAIRLGADNSNTGTSGKIETKEDITNFYGHESTSESSDSSEEDSDDDDDDDDSESSSDDSDSDNESKSSSDSESEDSDAKSEESSSDDSSDNEVISRIPITKNTAISRQSVRKVVGASHTSSNTASTKDNSDINLLSLDFGNTTLQPTNTFASVTILPSNNSNNSLGDLDLNYNNVSSANVLKPSNVLDSSEGIAIPTAWGSNTVDRSKEVNVFDVFSDIPIPATTQPSSQLNTQPKKDPFSPEVLGLNFTPVGSLPKSTTNSILNAPIPTIETISQSKVILKPDVGGGLGVSLAFRFGGVIASTYVGASCAILSMKNFKDHPIRRIKISFPADIKRTQIEDIPLLQPGQEVHIPMEILLQGSIGKQIRLDIRSDLGAFIGLIQFEPYEAIIPFDITTNDFETIRSQLLGLNENEKQIPVQNINIYTTSSSLEFEIMQIVKRLVNVYVVQGAGLNELLFAGIIKKGYNDEKVLITIKITSDKVILKCNGDDPLICNSLISVISKALTP